MGYESGSFGLELPETMMQTQVSCVDVDECDVTSREAVLHNCDRDATCFNSPGSFSCSCNTGYGPAGDAGDGIICNRLIGVLKLAPSAGTPSIAGIGLEKQPKFEIQTSGGDLSSTPWELHDLGAHQVVSASLWLGTSDMIEVTDILDGNLIADARHGIAHFTNLDVLIAGSGYRLKFSMAPAFKVDAIFTGAFSVKAGPASRLNLRVQPSATGITTEVLNVQPVLELTDIFGNFNVEAISTFVFVTITAVDLESPPGWQGGLTTGSPVETVEGVATFTELALFGLGAWKIEFEAEMNFKMQFVSSAQNIVLNQLASEVMEFVIAMDINSWNADSENALLAGISEVCNLDISALEIMDVAAGSVVAGVALHVPDPTPYFKMIAADLGSQPSIFSNLGVTGVIAPGIKVALDIPAPPPPPPKPRPYTGIPFDVVDFWTETTQVFVITGFSAGIGFSIFTEVAASFAGAARISELASPEGAPMHGNRWHTGAGIQSGGAFRTFITQVQFVAALTSLGGRGAQPQFFFTFPEPVNLGAGNWSVHNQSRITDTRLPYGMRTLGGKLDWTNLRSNVTDVLGNADLFPRPCDAYAQQVTIGTCCVVLLIQVVGYCVRTVVHKVVERATLVSYGEASLSAAMTFPKWESLVITNTYYGITQVVGICIGSLCMDWMIGGFFLGLFPLGACFIMTYFTYQAVQTYEVVKWIPAKREMSGLVIKRLQEPRLIGKWKRQLSVSDSRCSTKMRYLMMFATAFNDLRDGYGTYYGSLSMLLRMICGIASGAAHDWKISAAIFLALYGTDLLVIAISYPYRDLVRNRMEVLLAITRICLVAIGFMYLNDDMGIDESEAALFWLAIGSIAVAFLYQASEIGAHIWSIAHREENPNASTAMKTRRKSHITVDSAFDDDKVVVPNSLTTFRDVSLFDDLGRRHQILDKRHIVLKVTIQGATGLRSVDCRRNLCSCIVKIGENDVYSHHRNFGNDVLTYQDGESVFKTTSEGLTLTAHSAWWNESFTVQTEDEHGALTFILWENVDKNWRQLGTAIVHIQPLLLDLNTLPQPLEKKVPLELNRQHVKFGRLKTSTDDLHPGAKLGELSLAFECDFARLWPLADSGTVHKYRLSTLVPTFVGLEMQESVQVDKKFSRSPSVRGALVGNHMPSAVSNHAAAENKKKVADATWHFRDAELEKTNIWDPGMPEGDENMRNGFRVGPPIVGTMVSREDDDSSGSKDMQLYTGNDRRGGSMQGAAAASAQLRLALENSAAGNEEVEIAI